MKKALLLTLSNPLEKQRIKRNVYLLQSKGYKVYVVSPDEHNLIGTINYTFPNSVKKITNSTGSKFKLLSLYISQIALAYYSMLTNVDKAKKYSSLVAGYNVQDLQDKLPSDIDLIVVEEIELLPIAFDLKYSGAKIILDLRDFYWRDDTVPSRLVLNPVKSLLNNLAWAHHVLRKDIYKKYLVRVDQVLTVCEGHADLLQRLLNIDAVVFRSTVNYCDHIEPNFRESGETVKLVYHGAAYRRRGLDQLIDAVNKADSKIHLHLYLTDPEAGYLDELKSFASNRVHFHEPVEYNVLVKTMNQYDAGIIFYPPYDSSLEHSLPNKFFEYIQSRLAVISGPSFDMSKIINSFGIGTVSDSFQTEDLIRSLNELNHEKLNEWKTHTITAAKKLSFENEAKRFSQLI
ncbi:MAG: hypothetical protein NXI08_08475 [bacterium]|nr:hypothetical protein [bacterium]